MKLYGWVPVETHTGIEVVVTRLEDERRRQVLVILGPTTPARVGDEMIAPNKSSQIANVGVVDIAVSTSLATYQGTKVSDG
jgi:hypothetical protein